MLIAEVKPREMIFSRTVHKWSAKEVVSWAQLLTGQLGHDYSERFQQAGINGQLLLSLDEGDLGSSPLNVSTALHRKIIIAEIMHLNMTGSRQPRDIWEYKVVTRLTCRSCLLFHQSIYFSALFSGCTQSFLHISIVHVARLSTSYNNILSFPHVRFSFLAFYGNCHRKTTTFRGK